LLFFFLMNPSPSAWNPIFPAKNKQIPFPILHLQDSAKMSWKKATQMIKICFGFHEKFAEWTIGLTFYRQLGEDNFVAEYQTFLGAIHSRQLTLLAIATKGLSLKPCTKASEILETVWYWKAEDLLHL
jgi:hypothetical protein